MENLAPPAAGSSSLQKDNPKLISSSSSKNVPHFRKKLKKTISPFDM